ncbi:hypothetical protein [Nonomuraea diastatica]|uniref:Uncharacterized protein n=1 Tax=Nonomuraea diastatica TaxID=1848329 RepID=A0A4R4VKI1_9ACTN|nr:hypothetical protein [Nonomuraea diastatica]TDD03403.1 hypothetical protein E1294_50740 [Nonomuraea diastatica]
MGSLAEAKRTADVLAYVRDRGLPMPRHDLVVDLNDDVMFVQERLPSAPPRRLTPGRIDAMVEINDRFAGALAARPGVPVRLLCLDCGSDPCPRHEVLATHRTMTAMIARCARWCSRTRRTRSCPDNCDSSLLRGPQWLITS